MVSAADRFSGLFFTLFGLAMIFIVNPAFIEDGDAGTLAPATLPNLLSWILVVCGACLVLKPGDHKLHDAGQFARAATFAVILIASVVAISKFGFVMVAPVMALLVMLLIGERRLLWLIVGTLVMPGLIWLIVTQVLDRVLP